MELIRQNDGSETWDVITGNCMSAEINYHVSNPTSKNDAIQAVMADAPASYGGLPKTSVRFGGYKGDGDIELSVVYENNSSGDSGGYDEQNPTVSFDCGGGTKHITHSLSQTKVYGDKDAGGLIGWNGKSGDECQISGVDVPTAQLRETYTKVVNRSALTNSFKRTVANLVGKVNNATWNGWEAGEALFLGMSFSAPRKGREKVVVTFNFSIQLNETNVKVGDQTVQSKQGWDYIWSLSTTQIVQATGLPKVVVEAIFVDQVCPRASFSGLGL